MINLKRIAELDDIDFDPENGLCIGPLSTINAVVQHPLIKERYHLLAEAAATIGTFQIRERGTIGGNICNGSPAADTVPALMCLGAMLKLSSSKEERVVAIEDFFEGPQKTHLEVGEILTQIQVPPPPQRTGGVYLKLGLRKSLEIAIVGAAALITISQDSLSCLGARLALASVAPTPLCCREAETVLIGEKLGAEIIEQAAQAAQSEASPISDIRGTAEYRREMVHVLVNRALTQAINKARQQ